MERAIKWARGIPEYGGLVFLVDTGFDRQISDDDVRFISRERWTEKSLVEALAEAVAETGVPVVRQGQDPVHACRAAPALLGKEQVHALRGITVDVEKGREYWAFQPPDDPATPEVSDVAWPRGVIDRFLADWRAGRPRIPEVQLTPPQGLDDLVELAAVVIVETVAVGVEIDNVFLAEIEIQLDQIRHTILELG